jgi:hypothetical protein
LAIINNDKESSTEGAKQRLPSSEALWVKLKNVKPFRGDSNLQERGMDNPFSSIASDLGRTVAQAKPLLMKLDNADTSSRPAEGKWAKKEVLGHLLDSASNNHQRFVPVTIKILWWTCRTLPKWTGISWSISGPLTIAFSPT